MMKNDLTDIQTRESGIECIKIFAMILIITNHVINTLSLENTFIPNHDYVLDLSHATKNIQFFILAFFQQSGAWGNTIFFVCSAWFLTQSSQVNKRKWMFLLFEVWSVSVIILVITYILRQGDISFKMIIECLMPNIFYNNWYITCYLLFYPLHIILNDMIRRMDRRTHFRFVSVSMFLYFGLGFIKGNSFFQSALILWIVIYFLIAYTKLYMLDIINNNIFNLILLGLGFLGSIGLYILTNFLGLKISFFYDKLLHWCTNNNPFLLMMSFSIINFARNIHFRNRIINYISKLSLLIYVIHENLILRTFYRPLLINYIYQHYGYDFIIVWVLILVVLVFVFALIFATLYEKILQRLIIKVSGIFFDKIKRIYLPIENYILNFTGRNSSRKI